MKQIKHTAKSWLAMTIVVLLSTMAAYAQATSRMIQFSGLQTNLPPDTTQALTVQIWDDATAGTLIVSEDQPAVSVDGAGRISFRFGSVLGGLNPDHFPSGASRFLDVIDPGTGTSVLSSGRVALNATAFALSAATAATATTATTATTADTATTATTADTATTATNALQLGGVPADQYLTTTSADTNYIRNTTTPQTGNFNISGNGTIGGNLAIGMPVPSYKLDVAGTLRAVRDISNDIVVQTTGGTNAWARMSMITPSQWWALGTSQNFNGNQFYLYDATYNQIRMMIQPNAGEISFPSPSSNHIVVQTSGGTNSWAQFRMRTTNQAWAMGTSQNFNGDQFYLVDDTRSQLRMMIQPNGGAITFPLGNVGIGTTTPTAKLHVAGTARASVLEITGGSDLAEHFEVADGLKPGLVVAIDPRNAGKLSIARGAYNRRAAGVISGANNLSAGMVLPDLAGAKQSMPVALSGRVWVYCDATKNAIKPGDLLTTSNTAGHAMKVVNYARAQGAIIGKAMTELKSGRGLVLVLVTLQ